MINIDNTEKIESDTWKRISFTEKMIRMVFVFKSRSLELQQIVVDFNESLEDICLLWVNTQTDMEEFCLIICFEINNISEEKEI